MGTQPSRSTRSPALTIPIEAAINPRSSGTGPRFGLYVKANFEGHLLYRKGGEEDISSTLSGSRWDSMLTTIQLLVEACSLDSIGDKVVTAVSAAAGGSVGDRAGTRDKEELFASVQDGLWAYVGGLFPRVQLWEICPRTGPTPLAAPVDAVVRGYVPSFDGGLWLHTGLDADIAWEEDLALSAVTDELCYAAVRAEGHASYTNENTCFVTDKVVTEKNVDMEPVVGHDFGISCFPSLPSAAAYGVIPSENIVRWCL